MHLVIIAITEIATMLYAVTHESAKYEQEKRMYNVIGFYVVLLVLFALSLAPVKSLLEIVPILCNFIVAMYTALFVAASVCYCRHIKLAW